MAVTFYFSKEHVIGADPILAIAIHGLVDNELFKGFAVVCNAYQLIDIAFEVSVVLCHGAKES